MATGIPPIGGINGIFKVLSHEPRANGYKYPAGRRDHGEMTESAEGARLLSECTP